MSASGGSDKPALLRPAGESPSRRGRDSGVDAAGRRRAAAGPPRFRIGNDSSKASGQPANMNLFGRRRSKPRGAPASKDPAQTIVSLRGTLDTLEKRQAHLDKQIAKQVAEAKAKMAKKDRRGALFCLKKKKMYEAEISA